MSSFSPITSPTEQLHRVAEIDRDRDGAGPRRERGRERQQEGDAGDDDGDRMDVDPRHVLGRDARPIGGRQARVLGFREEAAYRVEQERAGAAGRVEHMLFERAIDDALHHLRGEPVGRVVFPEAMALVPVDQRLVEDLEHVALDLAEAEAAHMGRDAAHDLLAFRIGHDPIEEIALDGAGDPDGLEGAPGQEQARIVLAKAEHGDGDRPSPR